MTDFDVFNGDADGLCALTQLRLAQPRDEAGNAIGHLVRVKLCDRWRAMHHALIAPVTRPPRR